MATRTVQALLPEISKASDEVERTRGIPAPLLAMLAEAGCLRMMAPVEHGGSGLALADALRVIEQVATADGSVAWSIGQVALSQLIIGCAAPAAISTVFAAGPDVYAAGAVAPKGRATEVDGGWKVTGQWSFVTGCDRASWLYLNCVLVTGRSVRLDPAGRPATRILLLPADQVTIVDTWHTLGLRGTGSKDVAVTGAFCPQQHSVELVAGSEQAARAADRIAQSSLIIAAAAVGIAAAALQDVTQLAVGGKRPALSATRLASSANFQEGLGEGHAVLSAARALVYSLATSATPVPDSTSPTAVRRAQTRAGAAQATALAAQATDIAYGLAGGTAVYDNCPLQRRLRDIRTATQHFVAGRNSYTSFGAALVGQIGEAGPL